MKNKVLGVSVILIAIVELVMTLQLVPAFVAAGDPGPKVFPMISVLLFFVCGIAVYFQKEDSNKAFLSREQWKRLGLLFMLLVAYTLVMFIFGFIPSTMIMLFVLCTLFAGDTKVALPIRITYGVVLSLFIWYLLERVFMVPLPAGILFE